MSDLKNSLVLLGKDCVFEIEEVTGLPDSQQKSWVKIGGIETIELSYDATTEDTTNPDSDGWSEHLVTQRSLTITINGAKRVNAETKELQAGQKILFEKYTYDNPIGYTSLAKFRYTPVLKVDNTTSNQAIEIQGSVSVKESVDKFGKCTWSADITGSGKPTSVTLS